MSADPPIRDFAPDGGDWADGRRRDREAIVAELEELLVQGGAAVVATDLDGVVTHWSAGAQRLYGWSADEAIGQPVLELLAEPGDRAVAAANMKSMHSTGTWEGEFAVRRKDGGVVPAYVRGTVIKDDAGRPVGLLGLSMDVSAPPPVS
jgi:PAS domain S-box-containing protein